jgi:hypothetical protein
MKTNFGGVRYYHKLESHLKHISGAHSAYSNMFKSLNSTTKRLSSLLDILFLLGEHGTKIDLSVIVRFFIDDVNCMLAAEHLEFSDELYEDETELSQRIYEPNQTFEEMRARIELTFKPDYTQLPSLITVEKLMILALIEADQTHWNKFLESLAQVDIIQLINQLDTAAQGVIYTLQLEKETIYEPGSNMAASYPALFNQDIIPYYEGDGGIEAVVNAARDEVRTFLLGLI